MKNKKLFGVAASIAIGLSFNSSAQAQNLPSSSDGLMPSFTYPEPQAEILSIPALSSSEETFTTPDYTPSSSNDHFTTPDYNMPTSEPDFKDPKPRSEDLEKWLKCRENALEDWDKLSLPEKTSWLNSGGRSGFLMAKCGRKPKTGLAEPEEIDEIFNPHDSLMP